MTLEIKGFEKAINDHKLYDRQQFTDKLNALLPLDNEESLVELKYIFNDIVNGVLLSVGTEEEIRDTINVNGKTLNIRLPKWVFLIVSGYYPGSSAYGYAQQQINPALKKYQQFLGFIFTNLPNVYMHSLKNLHISITNWHLVELSSDEGRSVYEIITEPTYRELQRSLLDLVNEAKELAKTLPYPFNEIVTPDRAPEETGEPEAPTEE